MTRINTREKKRTQRQKKRQRKRINKITSIEIKVRKIGLKITVIKK